MQFYLLMDEHNEQKKAADLNKWATHRNEIMSPASCSCCRDDPGYLLIYSDSVTEVKSIHDHREVWNKTNAGRNTVNIKTTLIVLKQAKSSFREMTVFIWKYESVSLCFLSVGSGL